MESLKDLLKNRKEKKVESERGELLRFFKEHLTNQKGKPYSYSFLGMKLAHLSVPDLYFLRSICIDGENRGQPFGKVFWGSIKPKP